VRAFALMCFLIFMLTCSQASNAAGRGPATTRVSGEMPDVLALAEGSRVKSPQDWPKRRAELLELIQTYEYGHLPPAGGETSFVELVSHKTPGGVHRQYKVTCGPGGKVSFVLDLSVPKGEGKFPVIVRGDACWSKTAPEVTEKLLARGYALAEFNRCELAPDNSNRNAGLYLAYPDGDFGALIAWAWGFHRCVDVLEKLNDIDSKKIAVLGLSRGGKASLLAGATDERIALTLANQSGCGGAGSFKIQPDDCEKLVNILKSFPFWFTPKLHDYIGKEESLPLDQHFVKALIAPRAVLTTESFDVRWGNPYGTFQTHLAAKEVYRFLGAEPKIGIWFRSGKHEQNESDWLAMLAFADKVFAGKKSEIDFAPNPFKKTE